MEDYQTFTKHTDSVLSNEKPFINLDLNQKYGSFMTGKGIKNGIINNKVINGKKNVAVHLLVFN